MAVSGIEGGNGQFVILLESTSVHGFVPVRPTECGFGTVKVYNQACPQFQLNDSVFFDKTKSQIFRSGAITYNVVDQQYIFFTETPA